MNFATRSFCKLVSHVRASNMIGMLYGFHVYRARRQNLILGKHKTNFIHSTKY